jgi:hypothetical protein
MSVCDCKVEGVKRWRVIGRAELPPLPEDLN